MIGICETQASENGPINEASLWLPNVLEAFDLFYRELGDIVHVC